jgi:hypothetical protein
MAMGLASMNPIPGATKQPTHGVVLIRPEDEDKPKYGVTSDFNANKYIALDSGNKPQIRDIKELDECGVEVFIIKDPASDVIFNKLVEMAGDPTLNRPLEGNLYEVFSNHTQYTEDQYRYDPILEKVYMDKIEKTFEGIEKEVDNIKKLIDEYKQKMIDTLGIPKEYYKECKQKMINTSGILKEYYKIHKINLKEE